MNIGFEHEIRIGNVKAGAFAVQHNWAKPRPWRGMTMALRLNVGFKSYEAAIYLYPPNDLIRDGVNLVRTKYPRLAFLLIWNNKRRIDTSNR